MIKRTCEEVSHNGTNSLPVGDESERQTSVGKEREREAGGQGGTVFL